jgi:hypothetical protein
LAIAERPVFLGRLFKDERRVAFRTRFGNGFVPVNRVAFRVIRAAVEGFAAFGFFNGDFAGFAFRASDSKGFAFDVIAFRVIRTRREFAETSVAKNEFRTVFRTDFVEFDGRRNRNRRAAFLSILRIFLHSG